MQLCAQSDQESRLEAQGKFLALLLGDKALCIAAVVALRAYASRVEKKAERLQAEALRLTPGVATLDQVRAFATETERPEGYAGFVDSCEQSTCTVSVGFMPFVNWRNPLLRPLEVFGIRPADYGDSPS